MFTPQNGYTSKHLCVEFLFLVVHCCPPAGSPAHLRSRNSFTHNSFTPCHAQIFQKSFTNLSQIFHTQQLHHTTLSHRTLAHTHTTLSHTTVSHMTLSHTTLSHTTLSHARATHTIVTSHIYNFFTHDSFTHNSLALFHLYNISRTTLSCKSFATLSRSFHMTTFDAQLCHGHLFHTQLSRILSHTAFHAQLYHAHLFCTQLSRTLSPLRHFMHNFVMQIFRNSLALCHIYTTFHAQFCHAHLFNKSHTHTHNSFTYNFLKQSIFHHLLCLSCLLRTASTSVSDYWKLTSGFIRSFNFAFTHIIPHPLKKKTYPQTTHF